MVSGKSETLIYLIGGSIRAIMKWRHYADQKLAPLGRSQSGSINPITVWLHMGDP